MAQIQYYTEKHNVKRVYFTGTDTLKRGHALCYDRDDITALARGGGLNGGDTEIAQGGTLTAAYHNWARFTQVEKPAVANLNWFAGLVADSSEGVTGPQWIDIVEPSPIPRSLSVFSDLNVTINSTRLFLAAGSYLLATSGSKLVGEALQTIDRSTDNGHIQILFFAPAVTTAESARGRTTAQLPTRDIWDNFPLEAMRLNPFLGSLFETDFTRPIGAMATGQTAITSGDLFADTATALVRTAPGAAGIGEFIMTGGAAHDMIAWRIPCPITVSGAAGAAGAPWAFEARVSIGDITVGQNAGLFFGLMDGDAVLDSTEVADTTAILDDLGLVGFNTLAATTETLRRSYRNNGQAVQATAGIKTATAGTYFTAGLYYDGTLITCFIDGVANTTGDVTNANLIEATPLFPQAEELSPLFALKQLAAAADTLTIDWVRVAQIPS